MCAGVRGERPLAATSRYYRSPAQSLREGGQARQLQRRRAFGRKSEVDHYAAVAPGQVTPYEQSSLLA
eukprot:771790-Pleurochrysis_carterae.AAC.1